MHACDIIIACGIAFALPCEIRCMPYVIFHRIEGTHAPDYICVGIFSFHTARAVLSEIQNSVIRVCE